MKHLILSLLFGFLAIGCNRSDDPPANPIAQLPPATTTGANTIGCLVNGEVFLPHQNNPTGPSSTHCHYQFVNNEWNFSLSLSNDQTSPLRSIHIQSSKDLVQGNTYLISAENTTNSLHAFYLLGGGLYGGYRTTDNYTGQLKITKLDKINHIISGTFYFDAIRLNTGEIIKITEGRFDMQYTP